MNWDEVEKSLRQDVRDIRAELDRAPANAVATNSTLGTAALVLGKLADAIARGRGNGGNGAR